MPHIIGTFGPADAEKITDGRTSYFRRPRFLSEPSVNMGGFSMGRGKIIIVSYE